MKKHTLYLSAAVLAAVLMSFVFWLTQLVNKTVFAVIYAVLMVVFIVFALVVFVKRDDIDTPMPSSQVGNDTEFIMSARAATVHLVRTVKDPKLKGQLIRLAEEFRRSDPHSTYATAVSEAQIHSHLELLAAAVYDGTNGRASELIGIISEALKERNKHLKH